MLKVWGLWSDLDNGGFNFPRSMQSTPIARQRLSAPRPVFIGLAVDASIGYGNYNAGFVSLKMADWRGLTMQSNFTWSKALGTASVVPGHQLVHCPRSLQFGPGYGRQGFDRKFTSITCSSYTSRRSSRASLDLWDASLGGWTFASVFAAGSGIPIEVRYDLF